MYWLEDNGAIFPHPLLEPEPVIGITEGITTRRLKSAYSFGIFPWYSEGEPVLWWFPKERCVLRPDRLKIHKSMRNILNRKPFEVTFNQSFREVILACSRVPRKGQDGTWITEDIIDAYIRLHRQGWAHSVEVWQDGTLAGGLYGVLVGRVFCGESMFSLVSNASKYALIHLVHHLEPHGLQWIDAQQDTPHLRSLGAEIISAEAFFDIMKVNRKWQLKHGNLIL